jgi:hypothetical protein
MIRHKMIRRQTTPVFLMAPCVRWAAALLFAVLVSGCKIEPLTPTPTPTASPAMTPIVPLESLLPTLADTATPAPSATMTPTPQVVLPEQAGDLLFEDSLENNQNGWTLKNGPLGAMTFGDGLFTFTVRTQYTSFTSIFPKDVPSDLYMEVTARSVLCGKAEDTFGIIFRDYGSRSYRFAIACSGKVRVERYFGLSLESVSGWKDAPGLLPGAPAENRIGVVAQRADFHLFVAGVEAFAFHEPALIKGRTGLFAKTDKSNLLTVRFSHFAVYSLKNTGP